MDKNTVNEQLSTFLRTVHAEKKSFLLGQLKIMKRFCTEPVVQAIEHMHRDLLEQDPPGIEKIKHDKEVDLFTVFTKEGLQYEVTSTEGGTVTIEDILLPCDCAEMDTGRGNCPMCGGDGSLDEEEAVCPMCDGEGVCPNCEGEGILSVRDMEAAHDHDFGPEEEPLASPEELLKELTEWENPHKELAGFLADYLFSLDKIYYSNYKKFQEIYRNFFNTEGFDYPHMLFPTYLPAFVGEFSQEEDGNFYGTVEMGGEELLLTVAPRKEGFEIVAVEVECAMYDNAIELHGDSYLECECVETTADSKPDPECEACFGTGAIVCPICLGLGWIPLAPKSLSPEDIDNPERYRAGVTDLYDLDL